MKHLNLELEKLEQRIAPGAVSCRGGSNGSKSGGSGKSGGSKSGHSGGARSGGSKGSKCR
jgi:hypothetical protein